MAMMQQYGNNLITPYGQQDYSHFFYGKNNMPAPQPQQQTNNLIWVQGIEGAKALMLPPNAKIICLDSEIENRAYIKIADELGATKLRKFDLIEITEEENPSTNLADYVRKDELQNLLTDLLSNKEVKDDESTISTTQLALPTRRVLAPATSE